MMKLNIKLKERSDETKHRQISRQLTELIHSGKLGSGTVLPGEAGLAAQTGTSRKTIRSAYLTLESDGLVGRTATGTRIVGGASKQGTGKTKNIAKSASKSVGAGKSSAAKSAAKESGGKSQRGGSAAAAAASAPSRKRNSTKQGITKQSATTKAAAAKNTGGKKK